MSDKLQVKVKSMDTWLEAVQSGFIERCLDEVYNDPDIFNDAHWLTSAFVDFLEELSHNEDTTTSIEAVVGGLVWLINAMYLYAQELEDTEQKEHEEV